MFLNTRCLPSACRPIRLTEDHFLTKKNHQKTTTLHFDTHRYAIWERYCTIKLGYIYYSIVTSIFITLEMVPYSRVIRYALFVIQFVLFYNLPVGCESVTVVRVFTSGRFSPERCTSSGFNLWARCKGYKLYRSSSYLPVTWYRFQIQGRIKTSGGPIQIYRPIGAFLCFPL